jgi:GT2 family glycosyltransferase
MFQQPSISVVLGSYNRRRFLSAAIESVRDNGIEVPFEIIVVDGGSDDGSMKWLERQKDIVTIIQHNRGTFRGQPVYRRSWGHFMNLGFKCSQGKYILMISDDSLLIPGSVMSGYTLFEDQLSSGRHIGAMAFYWRNWPDDEDYFVGKTLGGRLFVNHGLFLRQAVEQVGWIDEDRYDFYYADADLGLKLWNAGYEVIDCVDAFIEHFVHTNRQSRQANLTRGKRDWAAFLSRWKGVYYNSPDDDVGGSLTREYSDPHVTFHRFPGWHVAHKSVDRLRKVARGLPVAHRVRKFLDGVGGIKVE